MIHTIRTVAVGDQESKIDSPIILYRGDREVEVEFTINGSKFTFTNGGNVIKSTNATHGQLVINTPTGENMFSEVTECHDGKVVFVITKEMIDELIEVGFYSFQIRLFDESQISRVTIPPVLKGIDIRNPIAAEDETNVVDIGLVDYAVVVKDEFEDLSTFLPDGNYNKTEWETKDIIGGAKLNKIEDALYNINSNMEATDLALLNRVEGINKNIHSEINKLGGELESEVEEFERKLNNNLERFKIDTDILMTQYKNEFDVQFDEIKSYIVNTKDYGAVGDGITDDTQAILNAIEYCSTNFTTKGVRPCLYFPVGNYKISNELVVDSLPISVKMDGCLILNKNVKHGFVFKKCKGITLELKIKGDNMIADDFVYSKDWGIDVDGMSVGVKLIGCTSIVLDIIFYEFYGRGIESYGSWQYVGGSVRGQVGQTWFIKRVDGADLLNAGIGNLGNIYTEEIVGSYFNGTDISIQHYENYIPKSHNATGVRFEECHSLWITTISVGYFGNDFILGLNRCQGFSIQNAFVYGEWNPEKSDDNCGSGLYMENCQSGFINLSSGSCKTALKVNGLTSAIINFKDQMSRDLGVIQSTKTFPVKAVTLNTTSKSRIGQGLRIMNGGLRVDGLTINANMTDINAQSADIYDIHVVDSDSIVYINGKVSNLDLPNTNNCVVNSKYDTINNRALIDFKSVVESKSATCINENYILAQGIQNKISRFGNLVHGTFAIEHPSKTGQLSRDAMLVSLPDEFKPSKSVPITLTIICNSDSHFERSAFIQSDGTVKLNGVGIYTDDIRWVCASFSYII